MAKAINISLIFNELLTNAIEHAYPNSSGVIEASLLLYEDGYLLQIKDYGRGFDITKSYSSLGLTLVQDLVKTLSSKPIEYISSEGTEARVYCDMLEER
jgi:two-component sensor histidine kinase